MDGNLIERLKYPIGPFSFPTVISDSDIEEWQKTIKSFPSNLRLLINDLDDSALNWIYRPEGWTIKQVVHHCSDSHLNALIRFKLALTEETPVIRPYAESKWAELADGVLADLRPSLLIIDNIHLKWCVIMENMTIEDWHRQYIHPEYNRHFSLKQALANYHWHCKHHSAHIRQAIAHKGVF